MAVFSRKDTVPVLYIAEGWVDDDGTPEQHETERERRRECMSGAVGTYGRRRMFKLNGKK